MDVEEMRRGLSAGRTLIQEEWADPADIARADDLIAEGFAAATPWRWKDNYQCEMRRVYLATPPKTGGQHE